MEDADWKYDWTYAIYIYDRTKAFDKVSHLWLVRCYARLCGVGLPTLDELAATGTPGTCSWS